MMYQNKSKKSDTNKKKKPNAQNGRMSFMKKTGRTKKG